MKIDNYTKFILTIIAVGIIGINFHIFNGTIINEANADNHKIHKIAICDLNGNCSRISDGGRLRILDWLNTDLIELILKLLKE